MLDEANFLSKNSRKVTNILHYYQERQFWRLGSRGSLGILWNPVILSIPCGTLCHSLNLRRDIVPCGALGPSVLHRRGPLRRRVLRLRQPRCCRARRQGKLPRLRGPARSRWRRRTSPTTTTDIDPLLIRADDTAFELAALGVRAGGASCGAR